METLLTPSVLPKLSNRFMDTLLTPADGADNRTDGPMKAKENGASTNMAKGCLVPFVRPWCFRGHVAWRKSADSQPFCRILYVSRRVQHMRCFRDFDFNQ